MLLIPSINAPPLHMVLSYQRSLWRLRWSDTIKWRLYDGRDAVLQMWCNDKMLICSFYPIPVRFRPQYCKYLVRPRVSRCSPQLAYCHSKQCTVYSPSSTINGVRTDTQIIGAIDLKRLRFLRDVREINFWRSARTPLPARYK